MKKLLGIAIITFCLGATSYAQDTDRTGAKVKRSVQKGAKKVGNKTAEVASKSKAKVTDETYKDKVGPNGETIYIDNHSKYYWVDKQGHRHYTDASALKPKND
jgi:hypothetical protein